MGAAYHSNGERGDDGSQPDKTEQQKGTEWITRFRRFTGRNEDEGRKFESHLSSRLSRLDAPAPWNGAIFFECSGAGPRR